MAFIGLGLSVFGQKFLTRTGTIQFFSETDIENIEAINNQVSSVINIDNGEMAFTLLLKAFAFEKALMQEHFNEKYVESEKFPKSSFKGSIVDFSSSDLSKTPKEYSVKGDLTIHGITKKIEVKMTLIVNSENQIIGTSIFTIKLEDYDIKVPSAVRSQISETIEINVKLDYEKMD